MATKAEAKASGSASTTDKGEAVERAQAVTENPSGPAIPLSDNPVKSVTEVELPCWVVVHGEKSAIKGAIGKAKAKVLESVDSPFKARVTQVIFFENGSDGRAFSHVVNGTVFTNEVNANEYARHIANGN